MSYFWCLIWKSHLRFNVERQINSSSTNQHLQMKVAMGSLNILVVSKLMNWNFGTWVKPLCDSNNDYLLHTRLFWFLCAPWWHKKFLYKFLGLILKIFPVLLQVHFAMSSLFVFFSQIAKLSSESRLENCNAGLGMPLLCSLLVCGKHV